MLAIRPHHLNCMFFYKGKGYSEAFVQKMTEVVTLLRKDPLTTIVLVEDYDVICAPCPQKIEGVCTSLEHVKQLDRATLKVYNLEVGRLYTFAELKGRLYEPFDKKKFIHICQGCEWYKQGICKEDTIEEQYNLWK